MKKSLQEKLTTLSSRYSDIGILLGDPNVISDQNRYRELGKEYAQLEPIVICFKEYEKNLEAISSAQEMLQENDAELKSLVEEEINQLNESQLKLEGQLKTLLLPNDPNDERNVFLEIRAGTGGLEAALFAGDLFRMYSRFAEQRKWKINIVSQHESEQGGYKEIIARIVGQGVYSQLKFESGVHRVQRVPTTESEGLVVAQPKSASLICPSSVKRIFSGLRSRWITPLSRIYLRA